MDHADLLSNPPHPVRVRFELAAARMADAWVAAGRVGPTADDLRIAGEFLAQFGLQIVPLSAGRLRLVRRGGHPEDVTPETVVLLAFRRLADKARCLRTPLDLEPPASPRDAAA